MPRANRRRPEGPGGKRGPRGSGSQPRTGSTARRPGDGPWGPGSGGWGHADHADRDPGRELESAIFGGERRETHPDGVWVVRRVSARREGRSFRCPGCQQSFTDMVAHIVAWPAHGLSGVDDRRHWHLKCWQNRDRRPPRGSHR